MTGCRDACERMEIVRRTIDSLEVYLVGLPDGQRILIGVAQRIVQRNLQQVFLLRIANGNSEAADVDTTIKDGVRACADGCNGEGVGQRIIPVLHDQVHLHKIVQRTVYGGASRQHHQHHCQR